MTESKDAFLRKLNELIQLFQKLKEKAIREGIILENDPLYGNFEMLAANYNLIKDNLPDDLVEEIGEPIREIITEMVEHLKKEIGETDEPNSEMSMDLSKIDDLLKAKDISEKEMDELLDLRSKNK